MLPPGTAAEGSEAHGESGLSISMPEPQAGRCSK